MKIEATTIFQRGIVVGVAYAPFRETRGPADTFHALRVDDDVELRHEGGWADQQGEWRFGRAEFLAFAARLEAWLSDRLALGWRVTHGGASGHSYTSYYPPGSRDRATEAPRETLSLRGDAFVNVLGHRVGTIGCTDGLVFVAMRESVGIFRGRSLDPQELDVLARTNLCVINVERPPDHLLLSAEEAELVVEVAEVVRHEAERGTST